MHGGNPAWQEVQDRRSFVRGPMVECLVCNEETEDLGAQD